MAADSHFNNDAGVSVPLTGSSNHGATDLDDRGQTTGLQAAKEQLEQIKLPAQQFPGEINWLGSSYAGQDIKVVAHLYQSSKNTLSPKAESLQNDLYYFESLLSGANSLSSDILTQIAIGSNSFDEKSKAFDAALGLGDSVPEQRAKRDLRGQILIPFNFSSFIGIAKAQAELQKIQQIAQQSAESIEAELKYLEEVTNQGNQTIDLGSLQTMSIQSHRAKAPVRALGHSYVKGYVRGNRTLAGTMIFTVFDEHPLLRLIRAMGKQEAIWKDPEISSLIPDQLPPIDLTLIFNNEYGSNSRLNIYGVEFINDGVTFSTENLLSEQVMNFVARDVDIMTKTGQIRLSRLQRNYGEDRDTTGSSLLGRDDYLKYLDVLKVRRRLSNR